jgi:hypothetical protein
MKTFTLKGSYFSPGIALNSFDSAFAFKNNGAVVEEATITLAAPAINEAFDKLLRDRDPKAFEFSLPFISPTTKTTYDSKSFLVAYDLTDWLPDPSLGDQSITLTCNSTLILALCLPCVTAIRHLDTGKVFRNYNGLPRIVKSVRLKKASLAKDLHRAGDVAIYSLQG